ncbi:MAG: DNA methylase [Syntrophothermus sp.]|uniref:DNA methyltransferase n=1 Tax=Syntrophothermus sp. TaxID=2736299 RepID=UPI002580D143|nr:DNA methyltransferase [Syntrophothermus sp.]NSW83905.1 DNA methylase [Syntrophothermus sp.]
MEYVNRKLFETKKAPALEQEDDFARSCRPLAELLDTVRNVEGFPLGRDEDILALSDPPYYTACPNPYLGEFIRRYGKPYDEATDTYQRTPFVADVTEGKNDPIYNAHSYHTKVPHKAIMKYIEHYTEPGDIVFDGFCGSGMTGVAAQLLGRRAILCDLSPAATFIAYNYNTPVDVAEFERDAKRILAEVERECGWMYETLHTDGCTKGRINYTVWSDVFICPYCGNEYVFWEAAVDKARGKVLKEYSCPSCGARVSKRECERAWVTFYDQAIGQQVTQAKQVPVLINYTVGKRRFEKKPDQYDLDLLRRIEESAIPYWFPTDRMPEGYNTEQPKRSHGLTHVHHFYTKRNLWVLAAFYSRFTRIVNSWLWLSGQNRDISKLTGVDVRKFFLGGGGPMSGGVKGTLYVPSIYVEKSAIFSYVNRLRTLSSKPWQITSDRNCLIFTGSSSQLSIPPMTVDYIFTDPPFGSNLMYSELNFLWEAWLGVFTNNKPEAVINETQGKGLPEYKELMTACFKEMYRILKPNRWMTVVFHNSKAAVWNAIQEAITRAGFVIAQVTVMDRKQGTFKQVTSAGAVKNDLIINAYKPKKQLEENFLRRAGAGLERDFVADLLEHLPVAPNVGRTEKMLYSKMLAYYVQRGYEIRLDARQFYTLLKDNFKLIDGYWFTDGQVLEYEEWKKRQRLEGIKEVQSVQQISFVSDERSALAWLYNFLETPRTYNDIYRDYSRILLPQSDDAIPELRELLDNNFVLENGRYRRPQTEQEKEAIEAQRERELARAFDRLLAEARSGVKRLKGVRKEALIFGFTRAYREKRYEDILAVARKLEPALLETNSEINDFVEIARLKTGEEG